MAEFRCKKCGKVCRSQRGLSCHDTRVHPYVPPPPPAPKPRRFKSFADMANTHWGKKLVIGENYTPTNEELIIGLLDLILEELKKPRTLR